MTDQLPQDSCPKVSCTLLLSTAALQCSAPTPPMPAPPPFVEVLFEDNHLLAVNKPAMLPTMGVKADRPSLLTEAKRYLRDAYHKPGNVYLGVVSRLDAPVTGVVLMAKTSKAAARLSAAFRTRQVRKLYLAAVEGEPHPTSATLEHYLRHDDRHRKVHCTIASAEGAQLARLTYRVLTHLDSASLVEVELETGRKHQIRVQFAKVGHPILGDRKYSATTPFPHGIALHAWQLELEHPVRREPLAIEAPLPPAWRKHAATSRLIQGR